VTTHSQLSLQAQLRAEADAVEAELELTALLGGLGEPVRVGSAALGLMVRRDLDITVICSALDHATRAGVASIGAQLATRPQVREVRLRNDTGFWNIDPAYPDGLYLGVTYRALDGENWTLDIWFVDEPGRQPDLTHLRTLMSRLDERSRAVILDIKTELAGRDDSTQPSYNVYRAVLDHGITTAAAFDAWCGEQR
jgi:hypothetical protein